jgi:CxxC motif-containing protein (DUF1111 family)
MTHPVGGKYMKSLKIIVVMSFVVVALTVLATLPNSVAGSQTVTNAPTTDLNRLTDDLFNGFGAKGSPIDECAGEPVPGRSFEDNKFIYNEIETVDDGLGPVYNAPGCGDCHDNSDVGGISQIRELRAGRFAGGVFTNPPGQNASLIQLRAIAASIQERIDLVSSINVADFRTTLNTIGDGYIESIDSNTINDIRRNQPAGFQGTLIQVPVTEARGAVRTARFGWKNQHASLVSFSGDAYLNEMGITNPFDGTGGNSENDSLGRSVAAFDTVADPEDDGDDVGAFAAFMRQTRAPGRGPITAAATRGETLFQQAGCSICHTPSIVTAPPGTVINGGAFTVPGALGNKRIRPFSDFLLHDVGTGDGIVQNGGAGTRNMLRTPPLWGVRTRPELMHDGLSLTFNNAILRHAGTGGTFSRNFYNNLSSSQKADLIAFLNSL